MLLKAAFAAALAFSATAASAQTVPDYGADLQRFDYPAPVKWFETRWGGETLRMAYLDIAAAKPNGRTVLLLHGKNFCAATWFDTAKALNAAGYRVIATDQVGFCKSSKPADFQYSFHVMADLTLKLLSAAGVDRASVVAHSMGGVLGTRLALMAPARVEHLVMVAPLGLSDKFADGGSYTPLPTLIENERKTSFASIKAYQQFTYYGGDWRPEYDRWVTMRAGMYAGADKERMVMAQARTSDILQTQPVLYEFERLKVPTTFVIGMLDATGAKGGMPKGRVRAAPGSIAAVADAAAARVPGAKLIKLENVGHSPQVETPAEFERLLIDILKR